MILPLPTFSKTLNIDKLFLKFIFRSRHEIFFLSFLFLFLLVVKIHKMSFQKAKISLLKLQEIMVEELFHLNLVSKMVAKGLFKPEQKLSRLVPPRHEIAAYIIAGLLGIKNVPRDSFQSFKAKDFFALANKDYKMKNFMDQRGKELDVIQGNLQGSIQVFVPNLVYPKIDGLGLDKKPGIKKWMPYLKAKSKIPVDKVYLIQQMSNMIIFDFVIEIKIVGQEATLLQREMGIN